MQGIGRQTPRAVYTINLMSLNPEVQEFVSLRFATVVQLHACASASFGTCVDKGIEPAYVINLVCNTHLTQTSTCACLPTTVILTAQYTIHVPHHEAPPSSDTYVELGYCTTDTVTKESFLHY